MGNKFLGLEPFFVEKGPKGEAKLVADDLGYRLLVNDKVERTYASRVGAVDDARKDAKALLAYDFVFHDHGSIWLVRPGNDAAKEHLEENVDDEAQWHSDGALVVEPRYVEGLANRLADNGFTVGH